MPRNPKNSEKKPVAFTLEELSERLGAEVHGAKGVTITGINSLAEAASGEISLYMDRRYTDALKGTKASAIIAAGKTGHFNGPQLIVRNPALAYAEVAALFCPPVSRFPGISSQAFIHETSTIEEDVSIYPFVYVGEGAVIGRGATLFPGVYAGDGVRIGKNTVIYPNVTLMPRVVVGDEVIIHAGTVVGSDGFRFVRDGSKSVKAPQLGTVQIDDHVEIGANNTIDRAAFGKTWIKKGVKTDNLVQIAHNVTIGEDTVIVAQTGISGSATIGNQVLMGGQVGISDHIEIGDRVMIGSQSGVAKSIPAGEVVSGTPTMPHRLWLKTRGLIARLPELNERIRALEKRLAEVESRPAEKK